MTEHPEIAAGQRAAGGRLYDPPTVTRLGTLSELTMGAFVGTGDALGGYAGDEGSVILG